MNHQVALLACIALVMKFQGIAAEILTPAEIEIEVITSICNHPSPEVEERETEEEENEAMMPKKEEEE